MYGVRCSACVTGVFETLLRILGESKPPIRANLSESRSVILTRSHSAYRFVFTLLSQTLGGMLDSRFGARQNMIHFSMFAFPKNIEARFIYEKKLEYDSAFGIYCYFAELLFKIFTSHFQKFYIIL